MPSTRIQTRPEWIDRLLEKSNGARFRKSALQVNPFEYTRRYSKGQAFADENDYNAQLIAALRAADIEVIAVTDHFAISHSSRLISQAEAARLTVFPGFEAETKDGVHLLCLFEPGTAAHQVQAKIHDCGVHSDTPADQR